jgi:hypothetical protein
MRLKQGEIKLVYIFFICEHAFSQGFESELKKKQVPDVTLIRVAAGTWPRG